MQIEKITQNILYAGVRGKNAVSDFFPKPPPAYNAYVIQSKKTALIGMVHGDFADEFIQNIEGITPVSEIDYLICNYTGTEYTKSVTELLKINPKLEITATIAGIKNLKEMTNTAFNEHVVKNNEVLDLGGNMTLEFMIAPCLPWQDTMLTYFPRENAIFSGRVLAFDGTEDYYKAVLSPYSAFVENALELISAKNPEFVLPALGNIIKNNAENKIADYLKLCRTQKNDTVSVFCPSGNKNTLCMAQHIVKTLSECGIKSALYNTDYSSEEAVCAMNNAKALIFGTPTINKNASREVWQFLSQLDTVNAKNKPYFVFGSYGWSGEGAELVHRHLQQMKLRPFAKPLCSVFTPSETDIDKISSYTRKFAEALQNI